MSAMARVRSIEAVEEWKSTLRRFVDESSQLLNSTLQRTQRTEEWLQERSFHWQGEVERRQEDTQQARRYLEECRDSEKGNCGAEEKQLREATRALCEAHLELENVQKWRAEISVVVRGYRARAERLSQLLAVELPQADAFLGRAISSLQAYVGGGVPTARLEVTTGESAVRCKVSGTREEQAQLREALSMLHEASAGRDLADTIAHHCERVEFGFLPPTELAAYYPAEGLIVVNGDMRHKSAKVLGGHLAHEGKHVELRAKPNSIDQEYQAYQAQDAFWQEVKEYDTDTNLDSVHCIITLPEHEAKVEIRNLYPELPD
jgi:hypothetical protein